MISEPLMHLTTFWQVCVVLDSIKFKLDGFRSKNSFGCGYETFRTQMSLNLHGI